MRIAASWASEESVGSDTIVASSCGGVCGGDWDGDAPRAEGVSMIGKWRQDGQSLFFPDYYGVCYGDER
jgi:hypothetical protein